MSDVIFFLCILQYFTLFVVSGQLDYASGGLLSDLNFGLSGVLALPFGWSQNVGGH